MLQSSDEITLFSYSFLVISKKATILTNTVQSNKVIVLKAPFLPWAFRASVNWNTAGNMEVISFLEGQGNGIKN